MVKKHPHVSLYICIAIIAVLLGLAGYEYTVITSLRAELDTKRAEIEKTNSTLSSKEAEAGTLSMTLEELRQAYAISEENGSELHRLLTAEQNKNEEFEDQIESISGTVGDLDKLAKTDPELLQKYSKVYFLNEHYMPGLVLPIPEEFIAKVGDKEFVHEKVLSPLTKLLNGAEANGIHLTVVSAYRSFDSQKSLKSAYTTTYGAGANTFSADQGYSEHQLGTTVDFSTKELGASLNGFEATGAYTWLLANAHKYGFTLSYPKDNAYYVFEPWHWRYVGKDLAKDLHDDGKFFYDLDQREIDAYLISLF
jgi:D-alanyl-D-alanine carboxypeptidase